MPPPSTTAASRVPSAEEAMESQELVGALVGVQIAPAAPRSELTSRPGGFARCWWPEAPEAPKIVVIRRQAVLEYAAAMAPLD